MGSKSRESNVAHLEGVYALRGGGLLWVMNNVWYDVEKMKRVRHLEGMVRLRDSKVSFFATPVLPQSTKLKRYSRLTTSFSI